MTLGESGYAKVTASLKSNASVSITRTVTIDGASVPDEEPGPDTTTTPAPDVATSPKPFIPYPYIPEVVTPVPATATPAPVETTPAPTETTPEPEEPVVGCYWYKGKYRYK